MEKDKIMKKRGLIVGAIIASLFIGYYLFSMPLLDRQDFLWSIGGLLMISGVLLGGALSGLIIENYLVHKSTRMGTILGCIIGSIIISPLSLYFGIIFSTISGGMGENLGHKIGIGEVGSHMGIFIGIIFFIIIIEFMGALIGMGLGFLLESLIRRFHASS